MCVVVPRAPCWGNFQSPADPPRNHFIDPLYGGPHRSGCNVSALLSRPKEPSRSSGHHRAKGYRAPCNHDQGPSCPWTQTGVSSPASTKAEMSALPLETHRPAPRNSWAASPGGEESARSGRQPSAYREEHGPEEARSTRFLSTARRVAGGVRRTSQELRPVHQCLHHRFRLRSGCATRAAREPARSTDARDAALTSRPDQHSPRRSPDRKSANAGGGHAVPR